jgi:peroxiredoxin family protein
MKLAEQFNKVWNQYRPVIITAAAAGFLVSGFFTFFVVNSLYKTKSPTISCEKIAADYESVYHALTVENFKTMPVVLPAIATTKCRHLSDSVFKPLKEKMEKRLAEYESLYQISIQKNEEIERLKKQVSFLSNIREQLKLCTKKE